MQVKVLIDKLYKDMEIHVCNHEKTTEVIELANSISGFLDEQMVGTDERGNKVMLKPLEMIRFYAQEQKVFAQDEKGSYSIHEKLYELEKSLDDKRFMRISKSEIVNLKKIKKLDMDMVGTIKVILTDGTECYTSRRNVTNLKKKLGIS